MKFPCYVVLICSLVLLPRSTTSRRHRRSVSNTLGNVLGSKGLGGSGNKRRKANVKITPPLRLKPGETAEQPPGWQHCIKNMKATLSWKVFKSPGYPDFLESQIQCSWIVEAPIGWRVKLAFRDLDMVGATGSCAKQFVQIIDVATGKSQGRFCGASRPGDYVTLGTKARIDLQADKAVTKVRGFLISFSAVKEIPGFRSTKTFPSASKNGDGGAPGKVNVNSFTSNANSNTPKAPSGNRRGNRRLVYESDLDPKATDPSAPASDNNEDAAASDDTGTGDDPGWVGNDDEITDGPNPSSRAPNGGPLKYRSNSGTRRRNPQPTNGEGQIVITQSTLPVRIRAKDIVTPSRAPNPDEIQSNNEPVIYGRGNQPYDASHYSTVHPVRADKNRFIDHRSEPLSTTHLIIIIACAALFVFIVASIGVFFWLYRRRQRKRKKKKRAMEKKKTEENIAKNDGVEMKVMSLSDEHNGNLKSGMSKRELPGPPIMNGDLPPRYPGRNEFSHPRQSFPYPHDQRPRPGDPRRELPTVARGIENALPNGGRGRDGFVHGRYPGDPMNRHQTIDLRRQQQPHMMNTSQIRHHSLGPRDFESHRHVGREEIRRGPYPPYVPPQTHQRGYPRRHLEGGEMPDPRHGSTLNKDSYDNDYCSDASDESGSGNARMRREYSPWELEQQKKERRKKLINGEI